ncbi:MAG: GNAT family N-acetyltransferase [Candidatus Eisenbacteria bacterium]
MKRTWISRSMRKDDLPNLEEFRRTIGNGDIYSHAEMADYYEWKYFTGAPEPAIARVGDDGGKIVGSLCATIKRIAINGKIFPCGELGDGFVHPDYRKQGMFTVLGREVVAELAEKGVNFVYGRPNHNSYPGLKRKFGFEEVFFLKTMRRIVNIDNIIKNKIGGGILYHLCRPLAWVLRSTVYGIREQSDHPDITISEVSAFDKRVDRLSEKVSADYAVMVSRDAEYLNWRYVEKPADYRIFTATEGDILRGYVIVRCVEFEQGRRKFGYLIDMLTAKDDVEAITLLMGRAMQYFAGENVDFATTWVIKDLSEATSSYYGGLTRAGFKPAGEDLYFLVRTDPPELKKVVAESRPTDWFFRMGDTDGI